MKQFFSRAHTILFSPKLVKSGTTFSRKIDTFSLFPLKKKRTMLQAKFKCFTFENYSLYYYVSAKKDRYGYISAISDEQKKQAYLRERKCFTSENKIFYEVI